jgi:hypothetical protein
MRAFWQDLYAARVDVVINGHDHEYERFAPQNFDGRLDFSLGIREFVFGTGGENSHRLWRDSSQKRSEKRRYLRRALVTLIPGRYEWQFIPGSGKSFTDAGSGECH